MTLIDHDDWIRRLPGKKRVLAIGWLKRGEPFSSGHVSKEFFAKLMRLLVKPWQPMTALGFGVVPLLVEF